MAVGIRQLRFLTLDVDGESWSISDLRPIVIGGAVER